MDGHGNTSEEATSARGIKSTVDLESEVEVPKHDTASPCPLMWHGVPCLCPMPLQPHILRTSRPCPEGRQRSSRHLSSTPESFVTISIVLMRGWPCRRIDHAYARSTIHVLGRLYPL
ncbi:hypothetical protein B296_00009969 [Ensete ventricosum]|uniref:Uncharacterized protein n=1 Tax=Ensete ventricosum TaxID=4639 RepID=A0A427BAC5_ENSVE|nr:hypothetical protein B296_00009969 [Ensete ventricosum]